VNFVKLNYSLLLLLIAALITRLYGIWDWPFVTDEYTSLNKAEERFNSAANFSSYAIVYFIQKSFGENEFYLRLPFSLFGALSVPILYIIWKKHFDGLVVFLASVFMLLSAWHLWHSQSIRFYAPVIFFAVTSYYLYFTAVKKDNLFYLLLAFISDACAVSFHLTAVFIPIGCGVFSALVFIFRDKYFKNYSKRVVYTHMAVYGVAGLVSISYFWNSILNWHSKGQEWGYNPVFLVLQFAKYVQIPIAITAVFGLVALLHDKTKQGIFFLVTIATPVSIFICLSFFMAVRPDYLIYTYPMICMLSAYCCVKVYRSFEKTNLIGLSLLLIVVASSLPEFISYYTGRSTHDVREVVDYLEEHYQADDRVISYINGFNYYADEKYTLEKRPGYLYSKKADWSGFLQNYQNKKFNTWVLLPVTNKQLNKNFENWLFSNSRLVWRSNSLRFDYTIRGYEIYLVNSSSAYIK